MKDDDKGGWETRSWTEADFVATNENITFKNGSKITFTSTPEKDTWIGLDFGIENEKGAVFSTWYGGILEQLHAGTSKEQCNRRGDVIYKKGNVTKVKF